MTTTTTNPNTVTVDSLLDAGACYTRPKLEDLFAGRKELTLYEVLAFEHEVVPTYDKLWVVTNCFMYAQQRRLFACDVARWVVDSQARTEYDVERHLQEILQILAVVRSHAYLGDFRIRQIDTHLPETPIDFTLNASEPAEKIFHQNRDCAAFNAVDATCYRNTSAAAFYAAKYTRYHFCRFHAFDFRPVDERLLSHAVDLYRRTLPSAADLSRPTPFPCGFEDPLYQP